MPLEGRVEIQGSWPGDSVRVDVLVDGDSVTSVGLAAPVDDGTASGSFTLAGGLAAGLHEVTARLSGTDSYGGDDRRSRLVAADPEETGVLLVSFRPDWEARFLFPVLSQATGLPARGYLKVGEDRYLPIHPGASSPIDEQALTRMMARAELLVAMGVDNLSAPLVEASLARSGRFLLFPRDGEAAALAGLGVGAPLAGEWYVEEPPPSPIAGVLGDFELVGLPPLTRVLPVVDDGGGQALGVRLGGAGRPEAALVLRQLGSRRVAVALARGFWRWGFRDGPPRDRYRRLWSAVGGWMLADEPLAAGPGVRPEESVLGRGAPVRWQGWGYEGDTVRVQISDLAEQPVSDTLVVIPPSGGFETEGLPPGRYAFESALDADTTTGEFVVESFSADLLRRAVDPECAFRRVGGGRWSTGYDPVPSTQNLVVAVPDRAGSALRRMDAAAPRRAPLMGIFRRRPKREGAPSLWRRALGRALPWKGRKIDDEALEELEEILIESDFGVQASMTLVETLQDVARKQRLTEMSQLKDALGDAVRDLLVIPEADLAMAAERPTVYLMVGVNGVGKTTTIGKMAKGFVDAGLNVLVAAGDTYRAGATEQLERWAERVGAEFVGGQPGADPAAVAFDALDAAVARGTDVVLVDTAGRLHTHKGLMDELVKVRRVIAKKVEGAPHEVLLVLDATVGQNGVIQAREFKEAVDVSGIVLSKMDSTARGGVVVALSNELRLPVRLVGTGEGPADLGPFDPDEFLAGVLDSA